MTELTDSIRLKGHWWLVEFYTVEYGFRKYRVVAWDKTDAILKAVIIAGEEHATISDEFPALVNWKEPCYT